MEDRFFITPEDLARRLRDKIEQRGLVGLRGIGTLYRQSEENPNQEFDLETEIPKLLSDFGIFINHTEIIEMKRILGASRFGGNVGHVKLIDFVNFLTPPLNKKRLAIVEKAFDSKDTDKSLTLSIKEISNIQHYQTSAVTLLAAKRSSPEALFQKLIRLYESEGSDAVPREDFMDYYRLISAKTANDNDFITMVRTSWGI